MIPRRWLPALCLLVALLGSRRAAADEDRAAGYYNQAARLLESGRYADAAPLFERAFAEHGIAVSALGAARAWYGAKDYPRAADAYELALAVHAADPGSEYRLEAAEEDEARARLVELGALVGVLEVVAPEGSSFSVGHAVNRAAPGSIHLTPGAVVVRLERPDGTVVEREKNIVAGATTRLVDEPDAPPPAPDPVETPAPAPSFAWALPLGFTSIGLSAVTGGVAIGLGVAALGKEDDAWAAQGRGDAGAVRDINDEARSLRDATNVAWVLAGVFGAAGIAFVVVGYTLGDASETALVVTPSGFALRARF